MLRLSKDQVITAVTEMDLGGPDTEMFQAAVLLLLGVGRRKHLDDLVKMTGYNRAFVKEVLYRCRKNGIWRGESEETFDNGWWGDGDEAGMGFYLDIMVAVGLLKREVESL